MTQSLRFTLSYEGADADDHKIDFYDVSQALIGFQRSLALTTHLVLNNQVITQAPSLKNAEISAVPAKAGSWEFVAIVTVLGGGAVTALTASRGTVLGHLIASAYDYVIAQSLGFHVDFEKTLGQQYEETKKNGADTYVLSEDRFDSLIEKCETAIIQMHRPIVENETATSAKITASLSDKVFQIGKTLNRETNDFVQESKKSESSATLYGRVSSYNVNTFKGRIFLASENRPIPFILSDNSRGPTALALITQSLSLNALDRLKEKGGVMIEAYKITRACRQLGGSQIS
jgi:hypothetical protein